LAVRFIPTRAHGVLDYLTSGVLIAAPTLLRFGRGGAKSWVPVALGIGAIAYSLLTDYELGAVKIIPMPVHLSVDTMNGVLLATSPWLFGFADEVWAPHLALGLFEIGAASFSQTRPSYDAGNAVGAPN
jgi:hypothetical protein